MDYYLKNEYPSLLEVERLERVAELAGLTRDDLLNLLDEGLEVEQLMSYVNAAICNRMN